MIIDYGAVMNDIRVFWPIPIIAVFIGMWMEKKGKQLYKRYQKWQRIKKKLSTK